MIITTVTQHRTIFIQTTNALYSRKKIKLPRLQYHFRPNESPNSIHFPRTEKTPLKLIDASRGIFFALLGARSKIDGRLKKKWLEQEIEHENAISMRGYAWFIRNPVSLQPFRLISNTDDVYEQPWPARRGSLHPRLIIHSGVLSTSEVTRN